MEEVSAALKTAISELYGIDFEPVVTVAPAEAGADFATNVAMQLAKLVHKAPIQIANEIAEKIGGALNVQVAGPGFLNFISPDEYFSDKIADLAENGVKIGKNISQGEYFNKTVITEFSDPNPFKVLHVGHFYTSIVGDAISRMFECAGAKVVRANFGGDVGLHVAKTLYAVQREGMKPGELTIEKIAKAYVEGTRAYDENEEAHAEITALNAEIYRISLEDDHTGEVAELYWRGRELSYQYFEDFYGKIGVKFDRYYPESEVAARGLQEVKRGLANGVYEESDGAVVYKGEKRGLHTRVFINQKGLPTYEAKDVGLIFSKWDDYHFDESVVITGNDIIEYMKVVLCSVSEMKPELPERTKHLTHGQVKLPGNQKMSSRKGNFLKAVDVLEMIKESLGGEKADMKVVLAAIKYAFLKYKMGGDIIFDPQESVATNGNSGVYLLYSAVRAKKVLSKCAAPAEKMMGKMGENERKLAKKICEYESVLNEAVREMAPNKICTYLYELAQEFSRFYEKVKVAGSEREAELTKIVKAYLETMTHGLGLLGIEIPEEM